MRRISFEVQPIFDGSHHFANELFVGTFVLLNACNVLYSGEGCSTVENR